MKIDKRIYKLEISWNYKFSLSFRYQNIIESHRCDDRLKATLLVNMAILINYKLLWTEPIHNEYNWHRISIQNHIIHIWISVISCLTYPKVNSALLSNSPLSVLPSVFLIIIKWYLHPFSCSRQKSRSTHWHLPLFLIFIQLTFPNISEIYKLLSISTLTISD